MSLWKSPWASQNGRTGPWLGSPWRSQRGIWLPSQLFRNGEQGSWYDPQPQYLYQDSAGTTPVTADGDPVGLMLDRSPNGHHATQSVAASRPIYRTDGGLHWLEFDGVDDYLITAAFAAGADYALLSVAADNTGAAQFGAIVEFGNVISAEGSAGLFYPFDYTNIAARSRGTGTAATRNAEITPAEINGTRILTGYSHLDSTSIDLVSLQVDGGAPSENTDSQGMGPYGEYPLYIGAREGSSLHFQGRFFGGVFAFRQMGANDTSNVNRYLAQKAGVTLP